MGLLDRLRGDDDPRVVFIGIDGVPYTLLADHFDTFEHFATIAREGTAGPIDSIVPPESSACWPALTTGMNPGKTGVYGFQDREIGSYDTYVPMGQDVQSTRVWDRVENAGRDATVMNVPVTFPPQRTVSRMVSGFLSPELPAAAHPDALAEYLESIDYRIDVDAKLGHQEDKTAFIEDATETIATRMDAFEHYLTDDDWDLFFGVFMTTDRVNHFLFDDYATDGEYAEPFLEFYRTLDSYIGRIRELTPDDATLIIASDHGFQSLDYEVNFNQWLREEGWLTLADDAENLADIANDARAYSFIPGRFYLNLQGREPRGTVPQDDYETVRSELAADLRSLTGPDGRSVVDRVVPKEEAFNGPHDEIAPDLVAIPNDGFDLKAGFGGDKDVFTTGPRNGMHSFENATLFIDDPDATIDDTVDLFDIAPTILSELEIDYDQTAFDGTTLL